MPLSMTLGATTATSQVLNFSGYVASDDIRIQYSSSPDFANAAAPRYEIDAVASHTMDKLNQDATYFVRARLIHTNGSQEDWTPTVVFRTPLANARDLSVGSTLIRPASIIIPEKIVRTDALTTLNGYPVANLLHDGPTVFRSTASGGSKNFFKIQIETGKVPVDTLALLATNLPEDATVAIYGSNTLFNISGPGDADYVVAAATARASPNLPGRPSYHCLRNLGGSRAYRYWNFFIYADVPGDVLEIGHLVIGLNRASKNHSVDKTETPIDFADFDRMRDGNPVRMSGLRGRRVDFDISMLTQAQYETLYRDLYQRVGLSDPLLVVPNSKEGAFLHDRILYGVPQQYRATNPASPYYSLGMSIDSII